MKTSYRAINKAKNSIKEGRPIKPWQHRAILRGAKRRHKKAETSLRVVTALMAARMGAFRVAIIQSTVGLSKTEKALAIVQQVIDTAQAVAKSLETKLPFTPWEDVKKHD